MKVKGVFFSRAFAGARQGRRQNLLTSQNTCECYNSNNEGRLDSIMSETKAANNLIALRYFVPTMLAENLRQVTHADREEAMAKSFCLQP